MERSDVAVKVLILTMACILCLAVGENYSKAFEVILKIAFAVGYGALAFEAGTQNRPQEAIICNGMMAVYLASALQEILPFIKGERYPTGLIADLSNSSTWLNVAMPYVAM